MSRTYIKVSPSLKKLREEILILSPEQQRYQYFSGKVHTKGGFIEEYIDKYDDGRIVYVNKEMKALFNKKIFLLPIRRKGFGFDGKKLKMWWGQIPKDIPEKVYNELRIEWLVEEGFHKKDWITTGLLERVLKGNITNPSAASKYLIGANRLGKTTSPELLRNYIKGKGDKKELLSFAMVAKNVNHILEGNYVNHDLVKQANILGEKIDFTWSAKRLEAVHNEWTKKIMAVEIDMIGDYTLPYGEVDLPKGVRLLRTQKEIFAEGALMKHCIYTNYWSSIKEGRYMVLHNDDENYTIGLRYYRSGEDNNGPKLHLDQAFGIGNRENKWEDALFIKQYLPALTAMLEKAFNKQSPKYEVEPAPAADPFLPF